MAGDWRERVLARAWQLVGDDCPPRDAAPLLRLIADVERERAGESVAGSRLDQLEARRKRRSS